MTIDLRDRLETSFGDGPAHRTIDERLDVGRRALRRRRLLAAGATAMAVAVVALAPLAASHLDTSAEPTPGCRAGPARGPPVGCDEAALLHQHRSGSHVRRESDLAEGLPGDVRR